MVAGAVSWTFTGFGSDAVSFYGGCCDEAYRSGSGSYVGGVHGRERCDIVCKASGDLLYPV